jgi:3-methyladenine DNA glycosylase Mpg
LHLEVPAPGARPVAMAAGPRIGVAYAGEPWAMLPYRLVDESSPSVRPIGRRSIPPRTG